MAGRSSLKMFTLSDQPSLKLRLGKRVTRDQRRYSGCSPRRARSFQEKVLGTSASTLLKSACIVTSFAKASAVRTGYDGAASQRRVIRYVEVALEPAV